MSADLTEWVASKINPDDGLAVVGSTPEGFLTIQYRQNQPFSVAVIGVKDVVRAEHIKPLFSGSKKPQLVVNVPSKTLWSGEAILLVHAAPAAFGTFGDIRRAAQCDEVSSFRNKTWEFYERAIRQHSHVRTVSRVYDEVFDAHLICGTTARIALVDGYHVSAEDVRNAHDRFGRFDFAVKKTGYGSVTSAAELAAKSIGAEAVTFADLLRRLGR